MNGNPLKHPVYLWLLVLSSAGWMIYLSIMIYEHRKVLQNMGVI